MDTAKEQGDVKLVRAMEHMDAEGSIVRSGMSLAEAVLKSLDGDTKVIVTFEGVRGASSSYFNVFLRRLDEGCGLAEIGRHVELKFGSGVQKMVFDLSLESVGRGPRPTPPSLVDDPVPPMSLRRSWLQRLSLGNR